MKSLLYILPVLFWLQWLSAQAAPDASAIPAIAAEPGTVYRSGAGYISPEYINGYAQDTTRKSDRRIVVKGTVQDAETGDPVVGASVYAAASGAGTVTDANGAFSLVLPAEHFFYLEANYI